jgi:hypothetical protein
VPPNGVISDGPSNALQNTVSQIVQVSSTAPGWFLEENFERLANAWACLSSR